jgi:NAD(P)-dependent dehydrogenase (short-subunit alcohol dehydrogenase family)
MKIPNRIAIITGAAGGIGRAVGTELIRRGAKVIGLVDTNPAASQVAANLNREAAREVARAYIGDTTDETFRKHVFQDMNRSFGLPSICVPAAAITRDDLAVRVDKATGRSVIYPVETFRKVTEVNFIAPIYWAIEMVAGIAESRAARGLKRWTAAEEVQGTVIFIGSIASTGNKGQIAYSAAKAGLEGAAATLMLEAIYHGVRCGVIHPGFTDTLVGNSAVSGELWADAGWRPAV